MWIFTTTGFISAIQDPRDRTIIVRSRDQKSLINLSDKYKTKVIATPLADYPYRLILKHHQFAEWVHEEALNIDYPNFKSAAKIQRDSIFAKALSKVWSVMHDIEDGEARSKNAIR